MCAIHIANGQVPGPFTLDGNATDKITAYLFHDGGNENPASLAANHRRCLQGPIALGAGFIFDDTDPKANPLQLIEELKATDKNSAAVIFPYLGGDEILNHPKQEHHRFAIDFAEMSESDAQSFVPAFSLVERRVQPERHKQNRESRKRYWWRWGETAPAQRRGLAGKTRTLAHPYTSTYLSFCFVPTTTIVAGPHYRALLDTHAALAALQCSIHDLWAHFFSSSLEDRLSYTPSDCF